MPRRRRSRQQQRQNNGGQNGNQAPWGQITLGGFKAQFPRPRLPLRLGADSSLPQALSVYPQVNLDVPIIQQNLAIVAGVCASSVALDTTVIQDWATRFAAVFREYAIVGARLELRMNNVAVTSGMAAAFLDEQSAAAPTPSNALNRPRLDMIVGPLFVPRAYRLDWTPRDILDLDYVAVGTNFTPVWLKVITDNGNFGTQNTTTGSIIVTGSLALSFRGYV